MYYKHTNKSALRSQHMLSDALFNLMKQKPFHQISITEICENAAVGRKTFYRNFELKEDIIDFKLDILYIEFENLIRGLDSDSLLRTYIEFVQKNSELFIIIYNNGFYEDTNKKFTKLLPVTMPTLSLDSITQHYMSNYIIAGIKAILQVWIERNFQESIDEIIEIIRQSQSQLKPIN